MPPTLLTHNIWGILIQTYICIHSCISTHTYINIQSRLQTQSFPSDSFLYNLFKIYNKEMFHKASMDQTTIRNTKVFLKLVWSSKSNWKITLSIILHALKTASAPQNSVNILDYLKVRDLLHLSLNSQLRFSQV